MISHASENSCKLLELATAVDVTSTTFQSSHAPGSVDKGAGLAGEDALPQRKSTAVNATAVLLGDNYSRELPQRRSTP